MWEMSRKSDILLNRCKELDITHIYQGISDKFKCLEDIINNSSDEETVSLARNKLINISEQIKIESDIENIIKAQVGYDNLVTYNDESIDVIMPKGSLNNESVLKIKDIVLSKTDVSAENIIIIELK